MKSIQKRRMRIKVYRKGTSCKLEVLQEGEVFYYTEEDQFMQKIKKEEGYDNSVLVRVFPLGTEAICFCSDITVEECSLSVESIDGTSEY